MNVVPDTSAVIDGRVSEFHERGEPVETVYVPEAVVSELESQANAGIDTGWEGLEELQRLASLADAGDLAVEYVGERPTSDEIGGAHEGDIDAVIREIADGHEATLLTSDAVQAEVARAKGIGVEYVEAETRDVDTLSIEAFFDEETMSVHLRSGVAPMAKRGSLGEMRYGAIRDEPSSEAQLKEWAAEIEASARQSSQGFIELSEPGMSIVQFRDMRIAVAQPPFADGYEITAVRPIAKTGLDDYKLAGELRDRLQEQQRGVLISGAPGAGKSTFAQAVAEFLADAGFAVKTMEKTADSLLMVRPDYTIYDEVRKTSDFSVFADMRLAGVGMLGVVHATRAIDALQRLVGRVELGMIPQVVDTVVYIEAGEVHTVYDVTTEVKVPHGLMEEDLTRPVVVISDFETGEAAYEIYTFNNQVVTVPLDEENDDETGVDRIAKGEIEREIKSVARDRVDVEITGRSSARVYVSENDISTVIGKGGGRISDIEDRLGMEIDVRTHDERPDGARHAGGGGGNSGGSGGASGGAGEIVTPEVTGRHVMVPAEGYQGETVEIRAGDEYLFTATVSRGGEIQVSRGSAIAEELEQAIDRGRRITIAPQ